MDMEPADRDIDKEDHAHTAVSIALASYANYAGHLICVAQQPSS